LASLPYEVVEGEGKTARVRLPWGRVVSPPEVSAHVLARLKAQASAALGVEVKRAVVTVPAYFDDAQRQATRDAARLAGLEAVRIVGEPTAAALAYGLGMRGAGKGPGEAESRFVVVYDFGGGTFDVSVLRVTGGEESFFEVVATAGDTRLGGDDLDRVVAGLVLEGARGMGAPADVAERLTAPSRARLMRAAEEAKVRLSEAMEARVEVELEVEGESRWRGRGERGVTREAFAAGAAGLVERTLSCCGRAMRDARRAMAGARLEAVVLVGGSTRVPLVRRRVEEQFGMAPYTALDPDKVVALGAAVQGSILAGLNTEALLLDVVPLSLGIETAGGAFAKIIVRNSTIPAVGKEMFSTQVDGQGSIALNVLQGEREMAADCRSLGTFHLRGVPPMPAGIPQVEVTFTVDANGVLSVSAVERRSGKVARVQVVPNHGLSREEVERIEAESFWHAREDMARHRVTDLVANAKLDLNWIGKQLARHGGALEAAARGRVESLASELKGMAERAERDWKSVDAGAFHALKESLDRASVPLHEAAIRASLSGERSGSGDGGGP
jgi:molecular chaperone DnaK (HSP70)